MINWPPIMHAPSEDLKRCLGNADMHNETMWKRLKKLGYTERVPYIVTQELVERVSKIQKQEALVNFTKYIPKSSNAKTLLES